MANMNRTINERPEAKRIRESMDAKQAQDRANERAVVEAHRNDSGPSFTSGTETQHPMQKPVVRVPGG